MLFCQLCRQQENICSPEKEAESDTVEWTLPGSRGQYCSRPWDCQRGNASSTFHELKSIKVHVTTRFLHTAGKARALEGRQLSPEDLCSELTWGVCGQDTILTAARGRALLGGWYPERNSAWMRGACPFLTHGLLWHQPTCSSHVWSTFCFYTFPVSLILRDISLHPLDRHTSFKNLFFIIPFLISIKSFQSLCWGRACQYLFPFPLLLPYSELGQL